MEIACDAALKNRRYDADGRLHILRTPISKATVNPYYGHEIPKSAELGLTPERVYYMLRDPGELAKAAPSFARVQLMFKHTAVSADNPKQESIAGTIGSDVEFQAPYLIADLCIWDADAIAGVETETVEELSSSYAYRADMTPGMYEGQRYDGVMRDIQGNHVALVKAGRAGSDVKAADKAIEMFALDEFEESKHPRAENGEFGSGGSGGSNQDHPFIKSFLSDHKSLADQKSYLEKVPHEKLLTAHKLASKSDSSESQKVKKLIEKELDSRAERGTGKGFGEDHQLETKMTETKFGKALYAILCAASPKLAQDAALKPLVIGLTRKKCDIASLEPKLLAMDAELRKPETLAAMQAAKDAESEEESEEEKKEREKKEKEAKDKKAKDGKTAKDLSFEEWAKEEEGESDHKAKDGEEETLEEKKKRYEREKRRADDSEEETEEERKERMEKRKAADKKAKDCSAKDSEEEEKKKAEDGMKKAMDEFKADLRAADEARRAVRPVVGDVLAQDSAADIYGFALDQMKVDHKDVVGVPALRALFNLAQQASKPAVRQAFDAVSVEEKFTGAGRQIQVM
jgi:hypothetical protein